MSPGIEYCFLDWLDVDLNNYTLVLMLSSERLALELVQYCFCY